LIALSRTAAVDSVKQYGYWGQTRCKHDKAFRQPLNVTISSTACTQHTYQYALELQCDVFDVQNCLAVF